MLDPAASDRRALRTLAVILAVAFALLLATQYVHC
jgi:hypothetical protein